MFALATHGQTPQPSQSADLRYCLPPGQAAPPASAEVSLLPAHRLAISISAMRTCRFRPVIPMLGRDKRKAQFRYSTHQRIRLAKSAWKTGRHWLTVVRGSKSAVMGKSWYHPSSPRRYCPPQPGFEGSLGSLPLKGKKKNHDGVSPSFRQP